MVDVTADEHGAPGVAPGDSDVELTLYVNGASDLSARAIANARLLCDNARGGPFRLSLVDVSEGIGSLRASQVIAVPTLVRTKPLPERRAVGDLSHPDGVLSALGLAPPDPAPDA